MVFHKMIIGVVLGGGGFFHLESLSSGSIQKPVVFNKVEEVRKADRDKKGASVTSAGGQKTRSPAAGGSSDRKLMDFQSPKPPWLDHYPEIKKEIQKIVQQLRTDIAKEAGEVFKQFPHTALLPFKLHVKEIKLFEPGDQNIVSIRMQTYTYTGGAHGGTQSYSFNWNKKTKRFLSFNDLFPTQKEFDTLVQTTRNILFEKQKQGDDYDRFRWSHIKRGTAKREDFQIWNLHKNTLVVVFPPYQVASYAAGRFEITVPLGKK